MFIHHRHFLRPICFYFHLKLPQSIFFIALYIAFAQRFFSSSFIRRNVDFSSSTCCVSRSNSHKIFRIFFHGKAITYSAIEHIDNQSNYLCGRNNHNYAAQTFFNFRPCCGNCTLGTEPPRRVTECHSSCAIKILSNFLRHSWGPLKQFYLSLSLM